MTNSLVVGFSSGEVFLYKSDILKYKNEKPRVIHEAPHAITALSFKIINKSVLLFVATEHNIITILISGKDKDEKVNKKKIFLIRQMVKKKSRMKTYPFDFSDLKLRIKNHF